MHASPTPHPVPHAPHAPSMVVDHLAMIHPIDIAVHEMIVIRPRHVSRLHSM
jgi:hypothetical protein